MWISQQHIPLVDLVGSEVCVNHLRGADPSSLKYLRGASASLPSVPTPLVYLAETVWPNDHLVLQFHWDKHLKDKGCYFNLEDH